MTHTVHVRFLEPVDPRKVWAAAEFAVNAPNGFVTVHRGARDPVINAPNPSIWADPDQGADAWIHMYYGAEGSLLIEDDDPGAEPPPAAHVHLLIDTPTGNPASGRVLNAVVGWSPVPVAILDDQSDTGWRLPG